MKDKSTYNPGLSREDLSVYKNGNERQRREIEGRLSDAFDNDALEGWQQASAENAAMQNLDRRFLRKSKAGLYIAFFAFLLVTAGAIYTLYIPETVSSPATPQLTRVHVERTDIALQPSIDTMTALPEKEQIQIAAVKTSQKEIQEQPASVPVTNVEEIPEVVLVPKTIEGKPAETKISFQKNGKEIYYHGLKLIDYSAYRNKPAIQTEQLMLSGTPADQEKQGGTQEADPMVETVDIPYMDYINKTARFISKERWKESLQRLEVILKTYPDDVNAHFYAGLCSFNLQQYESASVHFSQCLQLSYNNFNEEASWYLARSYIASGEKQKAKELLAIIRDQKGYYSKQAGKLIKEL